MINTQAKIDSNGTNKNKVQATTIRKERTINNPSMSRSFLALIVA